MSSRKIIIEDKYNVLQKKINSTMNMDLFPPLNIVSISDVIYLLNMNFKNITNDIDYNLKINNLIDINCYKIKKENRELIIPDIIDFIKYIKSYKDMV